MLNVKLYGRKLEYQEKYFPFVKAHKLFSKRDSILFCFSVHFMFLLLLVNRA